MSINETNLFDHSMIRFLPYNYFSLDQIQYILIYRKNIQVARTNDKNISPSSRVYIINIKFIRNKCSINLEYSKSSSQLLIIILLIFS